MLQQLFFSFNKPLSVEWSGQKNPNRFGLGFAFLFGECPPPFSESVVTPFLAGDLAYQEDLNHSCATAPDYAPVSPLSQPVRVGHQKGLFNFFHSTCPLPDGQAIWSTNREFAAAHEFSGLAV
jgi:hypothetical protein